MDTTGRPTLHCVGESCENPVRDVSLGSRTEGVKRNEDGSVDLYVGPDAPAGMASNHLKTVGDDGWFVYFRLYAPEQPFFDKSFRLPDFERLR